MVYRTGILSYTPTLVFPFKSVKQQLCFINNT